MALPTGQSRTCCQHLNCDSPSGVPSMCDYSLHHVASRPAKVGDKLVTTDFLKTITRGFAAVGEPDVAVCLLPGTELAFDENRARFQPVRQSVRGSQGCPIPAGQHGRSARPPRRTRFPERPDREGHAASRRSARHRTAIAGVHARSRRREGEHAGKFCRTDRGLTAPSPASGDWARSTS
jgi:hypothetical protein